MKSLGALFILLAGVIGCDGGPLPPVAPSRVLVATAPAGVRINDVAEVSPGVVYVAAGTSDGRPVVYRLADGRLTLEYEVESGLGNVYSVVGKEGEVWVSGYLLNQSQEEMPLLMKRADAAPWVDITVPAQYGLSILGGLNAAPDGAIWVCGSGPNGSAIYRISNGRWEKFLPGDLTTECKLVVTDTGRAVVFYNDKVPHILISDDNGRTWTRENIPTQYGPYSFAVPTNRPKAFGAAGDGCYLSTEITPGVNGFELGAVISRDCSLPGKGSYGLAFASPFGPYFDNITTMAFFDEGTGYACGSQTSIFVERNVWALEAISISWNPEFDLVVAGPSGFWAVVSPTSAPHYPQIYSRPYP